MKFVFLTHCLPTLNSHGGADHSYAMLEQFKKKGYQINICAVCENREYRNFKKSKKIKKIANKILILKVPKRKDIKKSILKNPLILFSPPEELILPSKLLEVKVSNFIKAIDPQFLFIFNYSEGITVLNSNLPKITIAGDMLHIPGLIRQKFFKLIYEKNIFSLTFLIRLVGLYWLSFFQKKIMIKILKNSKISGSWCYQYAEWFRVKARIKKSKFVRVTLQDSFDVSFKKKKNLIIKKDKIKILTKLSSFNGTSTLISLNYLFKKVIPLLEQDPIIKDIKYEIHIIGKGGVPYNLRKYAKKKNIFIRGFVKNLAKEIYNSDIVLITNPAEIGLRTRILYAFANYGCCIIHANDAKGIPEIVNYKNCFVGSSPKEIKDLIVKAMLNEELRIKIKNNARKVFKEKYESSQAFKQIEKLIKTL